MLFGGVAVYITLDRKGARLVKVAIKKAADPFGRQGPLGSYAAVAVALGKLSRSVKWKAPRFAQFEAKNGDLVRVTLLTSRKGPNDFAVSLFSRMTAAGVNSDFASEICSNIILPGERIEEIWLDGVTDPPTEAIEWAIQNGWQVEEEPGPGRFWGPK
jgi:hypothetical protein